MICRHWKSGRNPALIRRRMQAKILRLTPPLTGVTNDGKSAALRLRKLWRYIYIYRHIRSSEKTALYDFTEKRAKDSALDVSSDWSHKWIILIGVSPARSIS
nr:hypothetical protein Iba_chr10dCG1760 [Ipomoea batatas]